MEQNKGEGWVCVTGATGFIAGHVIEALLRAGHNVRGTVRRVSDTKKYAHLTRIAKKYENVKLEFKEANLLQENSFDDAVKGCWGVCHVASPLAAEGAPKDAQKELVEPAEQGTLNVLRSCHKAGVKKVVLTSSVATISNYSVTNRSKFGGKVPVFTEKDNNETCSLTWHAYSYSKVCAEKAAWKYVNSLPEEERFEMASIHPSLVIGPQQSTEVTGSNLVVKLMMDGTYPLIPPFHWQYVDVRDVASAHVAALESPKAKGRYLTSCKPKGVWMSGMAEIIKKAHPDYPVPSIGMPYILLYLVSFFDKRIQSEFLQDQTCLTSGFDATKIERELDFKYKYDLKQTLLDSTQSMIDLGIVQPKKSGPSLLIIGAVVLVTLVIAYSWWTRAAS